MKATEEYYLEHWGFFKSVNPLATELFFIEFQLKKQNEKYQKGLKEIDFCDDRVENEFDDFLSEECINWYLNQEEKRDFFFQKDYKTLLEEKLNLLKEAEIKIENHSSISTNFFDDLHSFSLEISDIPIEKTPIERIIFIDNELFQPEFIDHKSFVFQKCLLETSKEKVELVLRNIETAIFTNCGNSKTLIDTTNKKDYSIHFRTTDEKQLSKKYTDISFAPIDEIEFKKRWLSYFINEVQKVKTAIQIIMGVEITIKTKPSQLKTKLTDTQRGKLFDLLVSGGIMPATSDREGFIWAFGGVNDKYTNFKTEWLKAKNLAVYLIDALCYDPTASISFWAIGSRIFGIKNMAQIKDRYLGNGKPNKPNDPANSKPKGYRLIDEIITEAQK